MTRQRRFLRPFGGCVRRWGWGPPGGPGPGDAITHDEHAPFLTRGRAATLGDVWDDRGGPAPDTPRSLRAATAPRDAYASGSIRSVDVLEADADGGERSLSVTFKNDCRPSSLLEEDVDDDDDATLVLCWVDKSGSPHHFRSLRAGSTHVERTYLGDAFVLARVAATPPNRTGSAASEEEKASGSDDGGEKAAAGDVGGAGGNGGADDGRKNKPPRLLDPEDVVAAYRPRRLRIPPPPDGDGRGAGSGSRGDGGPSPSTTASTSTTTTPEGAGVRRRATHVVVVTRRRHGRPICLFPRARGWGRGKPLYELSIRVEEGTHDGDGPPLDTSDKFYEAGTLAGWSARCEPGCWDDGCGGADGGGENGDGDRVSSALRERFVSDLRAASDDLPPHALGKLRKSTTLWINKSQRFGPASDPQQGRGMCYHPGADWLREVGMNPDKVGGIELYRSSEYLGDCHLWGPGGVLLHELSHAFHHAHVPDGYDNADVMECYEAAMGEGLYDCVRVHGSQGPECRAYACTDRMEYFAELSVAFLGGNHTRGEEEQEQEHNKWFPFNRTQLRVHDPRAYDMLKRIWGVEEHVDDG